MAIQKKKLINYYKQLTDDDQPISEASSIIHQLKFQCEAVKLCIDQI